MCGILGLTIRDKSDLKPALLKSTTDQLFKLSESRGKESAGLALLSRGKIKVYKGPNPASFLIREKEYKNLLKESLESDGPIALIGHARLATDGDLGINYNNQPVIKDGLICVHNGIITNHKQLWNQFPSLKRKYQVDTEIILSLLRFFLKSQKSLAEAVKKTFNLIEGAASIAVLFNDINYLLLASNTGSLYLCSSQDGNMSIFASELEILKKLVKRRGLGSLLGQYKIKQIKPRSGCFIGISDSEIKEFSFNQEIGSLLKAVQSSIFKIIDLSPQTLVKQVTKSSLTIVPPSLILDKSVYADFDSLKRCSRCLLPETMPFIEFDEEGICNYCRNYQKMKLKSKESLEKFLDKYRSKSGRPDCLVTFSGGRDSSYGLHYIKNILKMNPVAYSYDWGMITDLARRNQARMCGQLGIEHILVSADILKKRANIRKNVLAWLKKPDLGLVPLFMAGDKQYFYYANKLKKQLGLKLVIYCENPLERTDFKNGFCGIKPSQFNDKHIFALSLLNKIKLAAYYTKQFLLNPKYFNSSILDTLGGYAASYFIPHDYLFLYQYLKWDEDKINSILTDIYDWEVSPDTKTTWRIGDGTAAFYNYIYYALAGFTENDTFRSNQIREEIISREEALRLVREENQPRYDSIKWYCQTIGVDFEKTLKSINSIPKLYTLQK